MYPRIVEWKPVERLPGPEAEEITLNNNRQSVDVRLRLNETPHPLWAKSFLSGPGEVQMGTARPGPKVSGPTITLYGIQPNEMAARLNEIDARIAATNKHFAERILPEINADQAVKKAAYDASQSLLEEARSEAQKLKTKQSPRT